MTTQDRPIAELELCLDHGKSQWLSREQAVGPDRLFWVASEICVGAQAPERDCNLVVSVARADGASYATQKRRVYAREDDTVYVTVRVPRREDENVREVQCFLSSVGFEPRESSGDHDASRQLRREITIMREAAERRNRQLDALGIVWCDGGCPGGMRRYTDQEVTAEDVAFLLHNAARARSWFANRAAKGHEDFVERGQAAADSVIQRLSERHEREIAALKGRLRTATQALDQIRKDCENIPTANAAALVDVIYSEVKAALGKIDEL
jgi:hypothetical protein